MSFLLDTNICSAHFRRPSRLAHWFMQYSGSLFIPTIVLGELLVWYHRRKLAVLLEFIERDLLADVTVLPFDAACAAVYGECRGELLNRGVSVSDLDFMIASVALAHDLTLVTHNIDDFRRIPELRLVDWIES